MDGNMQHYNNSILYESRAKPQAIDIEESVLTLKVGLGLEDVHVEGNIQDGNLSRVSCSQSLRGDVECYLTPLT